MARQLSKLRKREIAFALAMGVIGAGGAAAVLLDGGEDSAPIARAEQQQSYEVAPFEEISTVGPQDVVIITGDSFAVRSEGSSQALGRLEAVVEDGKLLIRPKGNFQNGFDWGSVSGAKFYVTTPRLNALSLAGSGSVRIDRIDGGEFSASLAGPGELEIAGMDVAKADFSIAGSGSLEAAGSAGETRLSVLGSGDVDARGLTSQSATISMAGSGDASLTVDGAARVSVMGSGDVDIGGSAQCTVSRMGSGEVRCGNQDDD